MQVTRRDFLKTSVAASLAAGGGVLFGQSQARASVAGRPNVILVLTDDQGYGDLSGHGNPVLKTPHLDALRKQSIRFTDFHVAPMCTPTRGQILTGRDAVAHCATVV